MKLLLLGRNGQIGRELQRSLATLGELVALDRHSTEFCGDLGDLKGLTNTVRTLRPDVIVNAAAYTSVDQAESEPELARQLNALAPAVLAQEAAKLGAWLVHYSTDYVFDGHGSRPWQEPDVAVPLNVYGRTKLEGDQRVQSACLKHLIFRTGWVYSAVGDNFLTTMLRLAQQRERIKVVDDQFGAPTGADLLADVTARAIGEALGRPELAGLYHLVADGVTSRHAYAKYLIAYAEQSLSAIKIVAQEVAPVPSAAMPTRALRPRNCRLDTSKICAALGLSLPRWEQGVAKALDRLNQAQLAAR